jgi:N-acetyl-gamma-glutamyl-phosphate reductase
VAIHYDADNQLFVARCAIDNLQKGAASTAVQNMNDALGWDSSAGLEAIAA